MRTWLFVPGHEQRKLAKALESEADAVVVDWEDAVPAAAKEEARRTTRRVFEEVLEAELHEREPRGAASAGGPYRVVRVNGAASAFFAADIADIKALSGRGVQGVMLAKTERPDEVKAAAAAGLPLVLLIESALGLEDARLLASAHAGVTRLVFGSLDFLADIGASWTPAGEALLYARSRLVSCSRAAGLAAPIDSVWPRLDDPAGLQQDAELARRLGFGGKLVLHPKQLAPVRRAFAPAADEVARAERVLAAAERALAEGRSAISLDGEFIDPPVLDWARQILQAREEVVAQEDTVG